MSVRKSLSWAFAGQAILFAVSFAGSVIVARLLSPREMGIFAIATATQAIVQLFFAFGVGAYIVRDAHLEPGTLDAAFTVNAILSFVLGAILLLASFSGDLLFGDAAAGQVLRVSSLALVVGVFGFRSSVMMQREMEFKTITLISIVSGVVGTLTTVVMAYAGYSFLSPAYGGLAATVLSTTLYLLCGREHASLRISLTGWRAITTFGVRMMLMSGIGTFANRLSELILGRIVGLPALGLYGRASNLSNLIWANVYGTATQVVFAQMSREFRETGLLNKTYLRSLHLITAVMWPLLLGIAVLSKPTMYLLYGEKWLDAALPLSCLMVMQLVSLCYGMSWELFVLRDETARQTKIELTRSALGVVVFAAGCQFSLVGATLGRVVDATLGLFLYYPHIKRLSGTLPGELRRVFAESGLLMIVAVAPALVLMLRVDWSATVSWLYVSASCGLGFVFWFIALVLLHHPLIDELRLVVARIPLLRKLA